MGGDMNDSAMAALRAALEDNEELRARFAAATTEEDLVVLAREAGVSLDTADLSEAVDVSDAELAQVAGGYTFPPTDWIYCDNPWTNVYCTAKC
jgi:predicted ribosomally synthesized peptide with nif11-like leader